MLASDLRALLDAYAPVDAREAGFLARMLDLLTRSAPFDRGTFEPGHFTASAFVLSPEKDALLLIHHAKLGRWLQPGGHIEPGDATVTDAACREAREEVGLVDFEIAQPGAFDVDIHPIPARSGEPAHEHFDLRVLLVATSLSVQPSDEVLGARWVAFDDIASVTTDESVQRAVRKIFGAAAFHANRART